MESPNSSTIGRGSGRSTSASKNYDNFSALRLIGARGWLVLPLVVAPLLQSHPPSPLHLEAFTPSRTPRPSFHPVSASFILARARLPGLYILPPPLQARSEPERAPPGDPPPKKLDGLCPPSSPRTDDNVDLLPLVALLMLD
jgi:hypothetical protein